MTDLKQFLLTLASRDRDAAEQVLRRGDLEDIYHPELEAIHISNARQLELILDREGLPGISKVGEDGAEAVWLIIQHAISLPAFQRKCLRLMQEAVNEFPLAYAAYLEDRIRVHEGKPQYYGTQHDWNEQQELVPYPIEDVASVDQRRAAVGLASLAESSARLRARGILPPKDYQAKKAEYEAWLIKVGWR